MVLRKTFAFVVVLCLIVVGVFGIPAQVNAYGVSNYSLACPVLTVSGWTDRPLRNPAGVYYVMVSITNLTRGGVYTYSPTATPAGSVANFADTRNLSAAISVSAGDTLHIRMWDRFTDLLDVTVACGTSSGGGVPSGYILRTMTCSAPILSAPAGPPLTDAGGNPYRIEVGLKRYVLLGGIIGPDGQSYTKMRASYTAYGFILTRCIG